jgi:hypothetical protein
MYKFLLMCLGLCPLFAQEILRPLTSPATRHVGWVSDSDTFVSIPIKNPNPAPVWLKKVLVNCDCANLQTMPPDLDRRPLEPGEEAHLVFEFYGAPHARDVSFQYALADTGTDAGLL